MTPKELRYHQLYMDIAERVSGMSVARRLQVGAVIVKDGNITSFGWNGMPAGWDNNCEYEDIGFSDAVFGESQTLVNRGLKTRPEVIHAERNAIDKLAKTVGGGHGSTLYSTHGPCIECAKSILSSGIRSVYHRHQYRAEDGINFLRNSGVEVIHLP